MADRDQLGAHGLPQTTPFNNEIIPAAVDIYAKLRSGAHRESYAAKKGQRCF
jgi:hypothetical protein